MYKDFKDFYTGLFGGVISEQEFQDNIISNFASTEEGLTLQGLC